MERFDVAVLGAGTAGALAALQLARRGLSVVAVDRQPLDQAGATWCNAVPGWTFDAANIPRAQAPELRGSPAMHLVAGWGPEQVRIDGQDVSELDMRCFVARMQGMAADAGADLRGGVRVTGLDDGVVTTSSGTLRARWIVDATGLNGLPWTRQRRVPREELCAAAQEVRALRDVAAARRWFDRLGVAEGEVLCFTGVAGGYSIVNVRYHGDEMAILTGSVPGLGHPSGRVLLDRFVAEHAAWVGELRFGGARAIPVRAPYAALHDGPVAYVGDAACQVYAAHGSGIGAQLLATHLLAEVLAGGGTPADYTRSWWRRYGGEVAASAVFQRFGTTMPAELLPRLLRAGLFDASLTRATLEQRAPVLDAALLGRLAKGVLADPGAFAALAPVLARMELARRVGRWGAPR